MVTKTSDLIAQLCVENKLIRKMGRHFSINRFRAFEQTVTRDSKLLRRRRSIGGRNKSIFKYADKKYRQYLIDKQYEKSQRLIATIESINYRKRSENENTKIIAKFKRKIKKRGVVNE